LNPRVYSGFLLGGGVFYSRGVQKKLYKTHKNLSVCIFVTFLQVDNNFGWRDSKPIPPPQIRPVCTIISWPDVMLCFYSLILEQLLSVLKVFGEHLVSRSKSFQILMIFTLRSACFRLVPYVPYCPNWRFFMTIGKL